MRKWYGNLKIKIKIIGGFLIVALIAGIIGAVGIIGLSTIGNSYHVAYSDSVAALQYIERISSSFQEIRANLFEMTLADDSTYKKECIASINDHRQTVNENLTGYKTMMEKYTEEEAATELKLLAELEESVQEFGHKREEFMNGIGMDTMRRSEAFRRLSDGGELHTLAQDMETAIVALIDYNNEYAAGQIDTNEKQASTAEITMIIFIAGGVLAAVLLGLLLAQNLSKRIKMVVETTEKLSRGDLNVDISIISKDEIGVLAESSRKMSDTLKAIISDLSQVLEAFADGNFAVDTKTEASYVGDYRPMLDSIRKMRNRLSDTLRSINTAAEQVAIGSDQVSDGAQALASGSTEQASSVEELTASVDVIAEQAMENSAMVTFASTSVQQSVNSVNAGNAHMEQLTHSMEEIDSASNQIANITKVIEDIAFQTNILALNAAIEAARAGSAGKGFAVVADEVRALAAKSSEAAKQTAELIENSVSTVAKGTEITVRTAQILKEIGVRSAEVTESFGKIEQSIEEQTGSIEQIKEGLSQISSVVQTNAATAEENSATSEEMSAQASTLRQEVGKFKLWRA
ncbi:methyl-accepting chemotaxis protein [Sedimentibacter sp.]|uniref:methyl-accepting chemotaxis protein n=1 Tax=Sedimentibacter sp. TaxID=1960295 RepID=UPI0028A27173|nr:methyl-accepting chemotaxis protein [Sedimentibacter sp.]